MNILSITAQKPHSTGSGTYLTELVKAFDKAGHKQAVVAGIYPDDDVQFPSAVDFYPVFFEKTDQPNNSLCLGDNVIDKRNLGEYIGFPVVGMSDSMPYPSTKYSDMTDEMITEFESTFIKVIGRAISELKPDVILCHHLFLLTAMMREHFPNEKVYGICHGSDLRQIANCPRLAAMVVPQIRKLDRIFALHEKQAEQIFNILNAKYLNDSEHLTENNKNTECQILNDKEIFKHQLSNSYKNFDYNISVIGSGYNSELFNCKERKGREADDLVRVCFAGKVSHAKGAAELLDAVDKLNAIGILDFELIIAGGCQEDDIKKRLEHLPDNVSYLGMLSQVELAKVYKSCDIFVLPSYYEGLGLVLIEAMASGLIPIATDLPGIKDWIDENVTNPNVRYIPMPEMASIDSPTEVGRIHFIDNLSNILSNTILDIKSYHTNLNAKNRFNHSNLNSNISKFNKNTGLSDLPDTSLITWNKVSEKILNL